MGATGLRRLPPIGLDPDQLKKVKPATVKRYTDALQPFTSWLRDMGADPRGTNSWDDWLGEWKRAVGPTKANFELVGSAVEFIFSTASG